MNYYGFKEASVDIDFTLGIFCRKENSGFFLTYFEAFDSRYLTKQMLALVRRLMLTI